MEWKDVGTVVAKSAPIIGGLLQGPVGAIVTATGNILASFLGVENTPEAVSSVLTPDALVKLKELEVQDRKNFLDWQTIQINSSLKDIQSAREREVSMSKANMGFAAWGPPAIISAITLIGFFLVFYLFITKPEGITTSEGLTLMLGGLLTGFTNVNNYYLGSSLGSLIKNLRNKEGAN